MTDDPIALDWDARGKRAQARQREQQVEAFAGGYLPLEKIEPILVNLASTVQGILSGIPDALRSAGIDGETLSRASEIVTDAMLQIATQLDGVASRAAEDVDAMESGADEEGADPLAALSGPKERRAARKPRGLGKPKHGGRATP